MKFEEIELLAAKKESLPDFVTLEDRYCYGCMKNLYRDYYNKRLTEQEARQEKQKIKQAFLNGQDTHNRQSAVYAQFQEFIHDAKRYRPDILNALKEHADDCTIMKMMIDCIGSMCHDPVFVKSAYRLLEDISG